MENSSAGCMPESSVIFPPWDKPLAGANPVGEIQVDALRFDESDSLSRYPLTSPWISVERG